MLPIISVSYEVSNGVRYDTVYGVLLIMLTISQRWDSGATRNEWAIAAVASSNDINNELALALVCLSNYSLSAYSLLYIYYYYYYYYYYNLFICTFVFSLLPVLLNYAMTHLLSTNNNNRKTYTRSFDVYMFVERNGWDVFYNNGWMTCVNKSVWSCYFCHDLPVRLECTAEVVIMFVSNNFIHTCSNEAPMARVLTSVADKQSLIVDKICWFIVYLSDALICLPL